MENAIIARTPDIIAAEINTLKSQARNMAIAFCIEIGKRLVEAKALVTFGNWGDWLKNNVEYSQSTANNFIRMYEEYGDSAGMLGGESKLQALGNLNYTQAVALLAVPAEERAAFVEENDVESMSTRELAKAIKERDEAQSKLKTSEETIKTFVGEKQSAKREISRLQDELKKAKNDRSSDQKIKDLERKLAGEERRAKELEEKLEAAEQAQAVQPAVVETIPEEVKAELEDLRESKRKMEVKLAQASVPAIRFRVHFDSFKEAFNLLLGDLKELEQTDPDSCVKLQMAMQKAIDMMEERCRA